MKKILFGLILCMMGGFFVFKSESSAQAFKDVPENFYYFPYIEELAEKGHISGYADGSFRPTQALTRAEAMQMLAKFSGRYYPVDEAINRNQMQMPFVSEINFSDVPNNAWYFNALYSLTTDGIISGYPNGDFKPNNSLTRGEISKIIRKMIRLNIPPMTHYFKDIENHFAEDDIIQLTSANLYLGKGNGLFGPNDELTRGELAVILYRLQVQQDLLMAGDELKTKTHYLLYDFDSLSEQQLMEMEQIKQHTYLVRGQQLEQFLAAYPFEASSLKGFDVNPAATYLATLVRTSK